MIIPDADKLKAMLNDLIQLEHQVGQELEYDAATLKSGYSDDEPYEDEPTDEYDQDYAFLEAITTARKAVASILHFWYDDDITGQ